MKPIEVDQEGLWLAVKLQPKASKPGLGGVSEGRIQLKVSSPPVEGAANRAAVQLLSKAFKCPKSRVHLKQGEKSRLKRFLLETWDPTALEEFERRLG